MFFSLLFWNYQSKFPWEKESAVSTNTTCGTGSIHTPKLILFILPHFDTYIQNQSSSASNDSVGATDVASFGLYISTNHHSNTDGKDNADSHSYETPQKKHFRSSSYSDTITTTKT